MKAQGIKLYSFINLSARWEWVDLGAGMNRCDRSHLHWVLNPKPPRI
jgi:hypothetical protein